ncbi:TrkH family potassium uptake protein [Salipiger marinus]|uniref:Trk system potassium uptake protein TrkH n=1 Tax=Salipiger marinus TaxID=555512 RepID=A0A1G8RZR6_9RHOB|nr:MULTISPECIES: TrkH family potassium uptake protein [Salipiger]MCD1616471.1 TrkH family potassium uptake protein [Salipiger manganoxidans]MEB3419039.1 TrkH family potassium uptake protein [Salipiger manganoxidans]SDJ22401.1 trk system potassium uptake protein TrkH [Salipiger marinus]
MVWRTLSRTLARRLLRVSPPLILAALYAGLILLGALLFKLPFATTQPITWSDALFTATSAVTVTGLAVFDVGAVLTHFGEFVLAVLIQLGGLGLMTFAVLVLAALGLPVGITGHIYLREDLNQNSMHQLSALVRTILKVVLFCEVTGALVLMLSFAPVLGFWEGLWVSAFHSISAFNNAGFSTFSDGLVGFATDPVVNLVIPALFIVGGIGYVVLQDIARQRSHHSWSLHTKIMLLGTAILIPWSVGSFALLEWTNPGTLGIFDSAGEKLMVSWFQGVTTRTAGFNTTDIGALHDSTVMLFISLMLIGGGPTSTAGGIKVTTFVVMILATIAFFRRQTQLHAFGRSIGLEQVLKVMALTSISVLVVFVGVFLLTASHDGHFVDVAFEVASAFGTVGLSRGYTTELTEFGRAMIIAIMFLGRVGPLTLGFFLATRTTPRVRYPEGQIHLG